MTRCKINNEEMVVKGIDEIPMFSWNTKTKEFSVLGHKFDGVNSIEDFINFINNLQQENEQLKKDKKFYADACVNLRNRNDKAIEVIDTQMKLAEDGLKENLRIIKFYLIKGECSVYDLTTEEDYKYKGNNNE